MNGLQAPPGYEDPEEEKRKKGLGYFGKLKRPDGQVSTEYSIGITGPEFDWKETEVPSLVPTLTKAEITHILSGAKLTPGITEKAKQHALMRIGKGLNPFAQAGEQQSLPVSQVATTPSAPPGYEDIPEGYEEVTTKPKPLVPTLIHQKLTPPSQYKRESVFEVPAKGQKVSNIVYQAARGFAEEAYLNIPKFPKPAELTEWEDIFEGAGRFAGFVFGAPMKIGKMGTQLLFKALKKPGNKIVSKIVGKKLPHVGRVLERVGQEATQLGLASAISDIEDVKGMPERFKGGATFGAIFGGMSWAHLQKMPLLSQMIRQVGTRALARTANLYKLPYEDIEQWKTPQAAQRVFDELLFSYFSARSAKPAQIFRDLERIQKEVVKNKFPIQVWLPYQTPEYAATMKKIPAKFISLPSGEVISAEMFSWQLNVKGISKILPTLKALPEARITKKAEYEKQLKEMEIVSGRKPEEIKTWVEKRWKQKKQPTTRYEGALPEKEMLEVPKPVEIGVKPETTPLEYKYGGFDVRKMLENLETTLTRKHEAAIAKEQAKIEKVKPPREAILQEREADLDTTITGEIARFSKLRKQQEILFSKERGKRFGAAKEVGKLIQGEKGYYAEVGKLEGELPKVEADPPIFSQEKVDNILITVARSPRLTYTESLTARKGILKLLGKKEGLPTNKEIEYLGRVFPKGLTEAVVGKPGAGEAAKQYALEATNVPRAVMAAYDLSFLGRQGIFVAARHPIIWLRAFMKQFKMFGVEKTYQTLMEDIRSRPTYDLMVNGDAIFGKEFRHKVALTERGEGVPLNLREEAFMGAELAEKIPIVGLGIKASNRAYTGTGNRLRADLFDSMIKRARKVGKIPEKEPRLVEGIIKLVNAATGRGNLPEALKSSAALLNATLFSPRLMSSRMSLLNPKFYIKLDPLARREALEQLFAFAGMIATTLGIAKLAGAEVEMQLNPLKPISADWGKIVIGKGDSKTRIDIMGGFQQYIRAAFQFMAGKVVSTTTGKVTEVGKGYKPITRLDIALRPLEYKLAPPASFAVGLIRGRTAIGEPFKVPAEIAKRFIPMVMQDVADLARDDPELLPLAALGFFGMGLQTYKSKKKKRRR